MQSQTVLTHLFFIFGTAAQIVVAQETVNNASVSGRVTDQTAAVVQGAQVKARQTETNLTSTATTDREGRFRFPYLRLGPYEITVSKEGFAAPPRPVTLTVGAALELPLSLSVGSTETKVLVTGDATVLEAARTQIAGTVSPTEIQN